MTYHKSSHLCDNPPFRVPTTNLKSHHLAPPLVLRDVGIHGHVPPTTPHRLHVTLTLATLTTPQGTHHVDHIPHQPRHVGHMPPTTSTSAMPHRFWPGPVNAATSTLTTSTVPHQRPPRPPTMMGHKKRKTRRDGTEEVVG